MTINVCIINEYYLYEINQYFKIILDYSPIALAVEQNHDQ